MTRYATESIRYSPGEAAAAVRNLQLDGAVVCILGRPSVAESVDGILAAAGALRERGATFLSALRRANVHGALEMGLAPGLLPGRVPRDGGREWFSAWGELPDATGRDARGILEAAAAGQLQTLVLLGADPLADFPDRDLAARALAGAQTIIAVDMFLTASSSKAHVVLAAAGYAEKSGTTTNIEGRVSRLNQKVTPPGTARPDWMLAVELADRMGGDLGFTSLDDVWDEIERLAPSMRGITRARLASREGLDGIVAGRGPEDGASGPPTMAQTESPEIVAAQEQGETQFVPVEDANAGDTASVTSDDAVPAGADAVGDETHPSPQAQAESMQASDDESSTGGAPSDASSTTAAAAADPPEPVRWTPPAAPPDPPAIDAYSLRLVASRSLYDDGTLVQHSPSLSRLAPAPVLSVNPGDLDRLGVQSGGNVRVTSSRTTLELPVTADAAVPRGVARQARAGRAADLVDASSSVTDVRVETVG
jgi:NADH-quinone oxidoreductase subunit G